MAEESWSAAALLSTMTGGKRSWGLASQHEVQPSSWPSQHCEGGMLVAAAASLVASGFGAASCLFTEAEGAAVARAMTLTCSLEGVT